MLLKASCGLVRDNGLEPRLQNMLTQANLPINWEEISSNESAEVGEQQIPDLPSDDQNFQYHSTWLDSDQAFTEYMATGYTATGHTGPSQVEQVNVNDSIILKNIY